MLLFVCLLVFVCDRCFFRLRCDVCVCAKTVLRVVVVCGVLFFLFVCGICLFCRGLLFCFGWLVVLVLVLLLCDRCLLLLC